MFVRNSTVYYSASDLTAAVACEWALMRKLDAKLGRVDAVPEKDDPMLARAGVLGGVHEQRALQDYLTRYGTHRPGQPGGVARIAEPVPKTDAGALAAAMAETVAALRDGADVVYQGTFFRDGFVGFADFLIRTDQPDPSLAAGSASYEVYDTKLARKAKITALLQLAAYAGQLRALGISVGPSVHLLLGNGITSSHRLRDIEPVFADRLDRLRHMFDVRMAAGRAIEWGEPGYTACGRCAECALQVREHRDVLLVAGMRGPQRDRLAAAGITTIDQLAGSAGDVPGVGSGALETLRDQARMQLDAPPEGEPGQREVRYRVHDPQGLAALPEPDDGDIFFDFEGDPLWSDEGGRDWGLEYLFGVIEHDTSASGGRSTRFRPFWAHSRSEEREALREFLDYVQDRRRRHPRLHIYHYADYERSHLQLLCGRHGLGETILDELLRENVFVDLYPIVKRSIRVSSASYGLKALEPLYMGGEGRQTSVADGGESIVAYVDYAVLVAAGHQTEADARLAEIAEYNRYDCLSTLRLRDWLAERAREAGVGPRGSIAPTRAGDRELEREEDRVREGLLDSIAGIPAVDRDSDQQALALAAAAIEYHRREEKSYWWEHFNREISPVENWADTRDVFVVEHADVITDWRRADGKRTDSRVLRLRGTLAPGSRLAVNDSPFVMYQDPVPDACSAVPSGHRGEHNRCTILSVAEVGKQTEILLDERGAKDCAGWVSVPVALTPSAPIPTAAQRRAILEWGDSLLAQLPSLPGDPSLDLLRRVPPRLADNAALPAIAQGGSVESIVAALLRMSNSSLAVQGPPGSGKTYVGAKVITELVARHGWKVGVVAQSHEVVENLLRRVVGDGLGRDLVAKRSSGRGYSTPPVWTVLGSNEDVLLFQQEHADAGFVLGGTAWDFANPAKVPRRALDLLVVDEAGQFSLANTIAVAVSSRNLLLLGDPQQLPQVSQGLHPEPVDTSALGWLSDGHQVLPERLGYFLDQSWRMHPQLCAAVSELAYEGRLTARLPDTTDRALTGIAPGLHPVPVTHWGNATASPEEAQRVVELVRQHLGLPWTDPSVGRMKDPLRPSDVIVVAPYNAQVAVIRELLDAAGFSETQVGTVDKFQGQEAPVAIVSLTASSPVDVPRGLSFLLLRNRLNVAISRAKWAAYLVHSPALADYLPTTAQKLAELSAFLRLSRGGRQIPAGRL